MATLLQNYVDAELWDAEDLVGRFGMVVHAAFLSAGFVPYGAQPRSGYLLKQPGESTGSMYLSRRYTAPQMAHRDDADAAVLIMFAEGSHVDFLVYLTTDDVSDVRSAYQERLDVAAFTPLLSRAMNDTEPWGSRICLSLGNGVCWSFLDELCRGNGLPLSGFTSLPEDAKVEILMRLADGVDLAAVECTSRQLRSLVADHELWKHQFYELWRPPYERWMPLNGKSYYEFFVETRSKILSVPVPCWKRAYVETRRPDSDSSLLLLKYDSPLMPPRAIRSINSPAPPTPLPDLAPETVARGRSAECYHHRRKVPRNNKKKPQRAGAIGLPRSRYQGSHR